ncbi:MAG: hypothetical protein OJF60_000533 [Burkholderiaceae bacterium]|jgi:DNA-binding NarL/FixJ family response regulator|nr:MAG: hypothetical protein OJF60_000533 [Burkholderiaceae bacterium]
MKQAVAAPVCVALVSASPLVRAGLRAGLAAWPGLALAEQDFDSLAEASQAGFGGAQVAIVVMPADDDDARLPSTEADDAWPALVLLQAGGGAAEWLAAGHSVLFGDAPIGRIAAATLAAAQGLVVSEHQLAAHAFHGGAEFERAAGLEPLTARELEVLVQMSQGLGNREIAEALGISTHTAKFHVAQIIGKLAASSRAHAVAKALRAGLVEL